MKELKQPIRQENKGWNTSRLNEAVIEHPRIKINFHYLDLWHQASGRNQMRPIILCFQRCVGSLLFAL